MVPAAAIQRGPQGTDVFTVKPDNSAEMRPVTVAFNEGNFTAIGKGLNAGETVVTDGQDKLQPGTKIEIRGGESPGQGAPGNAPSSPGDSSQRKRGPKKPQNGASPRGDATQ